VQRLRAVPLGQDPATNSLRGIEVRLTVEGSRQFGDVYAVGEPFEDLAYIVDADGRPGRCTEMGCDPRQPRR
jgi:hypothetical protein